MNKHHIRLIRAVFAVVVECLCLYRLHQKAKNQSVPIVPLASGPRSYGASRARFMENDEAEIKAHRGWGEM